MKKYLLLLALCLCWLSTFSQSERLFVYGHSLVDHRPPLIPTPSDETTVPHWLYLLAQASGNDLAAGGKYGFLPQHAAEPNISQWGYDLVDGVWDTDLETFAEANISTVMITAANFIQYQGPDQAYFNDPGITPISATETVFDWVRNQSPNTRLIIYENWPDMAPFLDGATLQTQAEFTAYNNFLRGDFHDWWLDYHDALRASRPAYNIKMVPVGPILADILESSWADQIPYAELYEDDAPHGRATLYFLAALITYPALYQEAPPANFEPGSIIHQQIRDNYNDIVSYIMMELDNFNDSEGMSRVYCDAILPVSLASFTAAVVGNDIRLEWATSAEENLDRFAVQRVTGNGSFETLDELSAMGTGTPYQFLDTNPFDGENTYRLRMIDNDGQESFSELVTATVEGTNSLRVIPRGNREFLLSGVPAGSAYQLVSLNGAVVDEGRVPAGNVILKLDFSLPAAPYFLVVRGRNGSLEALKVVFTR